MKTYTLVSLAQRLNADPEGFAEKHAHAWLVWSAPQPAHEHRILTTDTSGMLAPDFKSGPPVAVPLVKAKNAFPFGITIGHAESNDIVIRDHQVSRFHAYVQRSGDRFLLVDAESKNGTWLDGRRLLPSKPAQLPPRAVVRLGEVLLEFFEPASMIAWLEAQTHGEP